MLLEVQAERADKVLPVLDGALAITIEKTASPEMFSDVVCKRDAEEGAIMKARLAQARTATRKPRLAMSRSLDGRCAYCGIEGSMGLAFQIHRWAVFFFVLSNVICMQAAMIGTDRAFRIARLNLLL